MRVLLGVAIVASLLGAPGAYAIPMAGSTASPHYWQCVPIARSLSGIQIKGDAHSWWGQAEGRYQRGNAPKRGAVLAFKPHGGMTLGHVAAVSRVIDDRTILVTHSNWSPINGARGQIERDVKVVDVSDEGDWSRVRVWFAPSQSLGTTAWPVHGFIYPDGRAPMRLPDGVEPAAQPVSAPSPATPPRLSYAKLDALRTSGAVQAPRPTGRLSYLGKMLGQLK